VLAEVAIVELLLFRPQHRVDLLQESVFLLLFWLLIVLLLLSK